MNTATRRTVGVIERYLPLERGDLENALDTLYVQGIEYVYPGTVTLWLWERPTEHDLDRVRALAPEGLWVFGKRMTLWFEEEE